MTPTRDTGERRPGALRRICEASQVIRAIGREGEPVATGNMPTEPRGQGFGTPNRPGRAGNDPGRVQTPPRPKEGSPSQRSASPRRFLGTGVSARWPR